MCIDEFIHMPWVYTPAFFYTTGLIRGDSISQCTSTLCSGWWTAVLATWVRPHPSIAVT